ncbi:purine nucleoside phosphorylase YfiH [Moellerella wisconsensis]|uniref:purine nucleoside phosphorylase YfiH n=1 Tax=Moellerella wisconsensis TaxID=158849 RepID=UPI0030767ABB
MTSLIYPHWPQPENIGACSSTRAGGVSLTPFDSLNLGDHVGDDLSAVINNRRLLEEYAGLPTSPIWLQQVHGTRVLRLDGNPVEDKKADAVYTSQRGQVCAVMTADCLPVLFCNRQGTEVAAAHAGWRGLCQGVLEHTVTHFDAGPNEILAWLGPAIGPQQFEVGAEVRDAFVSQSAELAQGFRASGDKYLADIYLLAQLKLRQIGVTAIYGGTYCTVSDKKTFFSYRRDVETGRMASLIWIK